MAVTVTVAGYLAALPERSREVVDGVRERVRATVPGAEETISYGIPTFRLDGRALLHVAGWKQHVSVYPVPAPTDADPTLDTDLAPYVAGKGTLKLPLGDPVPWALVDRVIAALVVRHADD